MVEVKTYQLPPTKLIPNSTRPLLHYPKFFSGTTPNDIALQAFDSFTKNQWNTQWIYRYGPMQDSHYHSSAHECMAVLSGTATVRFGVADIHTDESNGANQEEGGIEILAEPGDVFVLPAGLAHKTFNPTPKDSSFKLLTPGNNQGIDAENPREVIGNIVFSGFTMIGCYPESKGVWDACKGGEHPVEDYEKVWNLDRPEYDPVLGEAEEGLCGQWDL